MKKFGSDSGHYYGLLLALAVITTAAPAGEPGAVAWRAWDETVFTEAAKEHRFVLLDLEAVWCHWCHVMDQQTYTDPEVAALIKEHYLAVKVDQDSRPDLSNRYEYYGWPATIIFAPDGTEIVKRRGFIPPRGMSKLLRTIVLDPSPENTGTLPETDAYDSAAIMSADLRKKLEQRFNNEFDTRLGGSRFPQKFLIPDHIEYGMEKSARGDKAQEARARKTLDAALKIQDPVWGGFYQYSTMGDWDHPHYEKIMSVQAGYLRAYTLAYGVWREPRYLAAAKKIVSYVDTFLTSDSGAFFTSQDADLRRGEHSGEYFKLDDAQRRSMGIPQVDTHIYARENGWMIESLALLYEVTGDRTCLQRALRAAGWIEKNRGLEGGGFRHDAKDLAGPYLGDTLAMARAFLQLYRVTADRSWLGKSRLALQFITTHFAEGEAGLISAAHDGSPIKSLPQEDENMAFVRYSNLMQHYTGDSTYRDHVDRAMRYLATPAILLNRLSFAGALLADDELRHDPLHLTIVGAKSDPAAQTLYAAALAVPAWYKRVEWWDRSEGLLPYPDIEYPVLKQSAAFICTEKSCSLPVYKPEMLKARVELLTSDLKNQKFRGRF